MKKLSVLIGALLASLSLGALIFIAPTSVSIAFIDDKLFYAVGVSTVLYLMIRRRIPRGFRFAIPAGVLLATLVVTNIITVWGQRTRPVATGDFGEYSVEAITSADLARYARDVHNIPSLTPYQLRRAVYDPRSGRIFVGITGAFINTFVDLDEQRTRFLRFGGAVSPYHLFEGTRVCRGDIPDSEGEYALDIPTNSLFAVGNRMCNGVHEQYVVRLDPATLTPTGRTIAIPVPIRILDAQDRTHLVVISELSSINLVDIRSMESRSIATIPQLPYDGTVADRVLYVTMAGIISPLGRKFSSRADIFALDLATGKSHLIPVSGRPLGGIASYLPTKALAFTEYFGTRLIFYDPVTARIERSPAFAKGLRPVVADNDHGVVYTGSHITGHLYRYDPAQARVTGRVFLGAGIRGICPLPDGNVVVTSSQGIFLVTWHRRSK